MPKGWYGNGLPCTLAFGLVCRVLPCDLPVLRHKYDLVRSTLVRVYGRENAFPDGVEEFTLRCENGVGWFRALRRLRCANARMEMGDLWLRGVRQCEATWDESTYVWGDAGQHLLVLFLDQEAFVDDDPVRPVGRDLQSVKCGGFGVSLWPVPAGLGGPVHLLRYALYDRVSVGDVEEGAVPMRLMTDAAAEPEFLVDCKGALEKLHRLIHSEVVAALGSQWAVIIGNMDDGSAGEDP